jgi:gliding motility-associated-like protein
MKNIFIAVIFSLVSAYCLGQVNAGNDTIVCNQTSITLNATYTMGNQGTSLVLSDDQYSNVINIGFPFTYFGTTYTQCLISSNNYITFDLSQAGGYSPWTISAAIPSSSNPTNAIMCPWQDVYPPGGGCVGYGTFGTAPNRIFVVSFANVTMFSCNNLLFTSQIILYEGSNIIETHITDKTLCSSWNSGYAIHGIQNSTGTLAYVVPGRNYPSQWSVQNEGYQFVPTGPTTYSQGVIPYAPTTFSSPGIGLNWYQNNTLIGTGNSITVNPAVTTTYVVEMTTCAAATYHDTVTVYVGVLTNNYSQTNVSCNSGTDGTAMAVGTGLGGPWSYSWMDASGNVLQTSSNVPGDTLHNLQAGQYAVTVTTAFGCTQTHSFTITEPPSPLSSTMALINDSCSAAPDAIAIVSPSGGTAPYAYSWSTVPVQVNDTAGNLGTGTYTVTITDSKGCTQTQTVTVFKDPRPTASFIYTPQVITLFEPTATFTNLSLNDVTWYWDFADGDTSSVQNPTHDYTIEGTYPVKLVVTNAIGCQDSIIVNVEVRDIVTMYLPNSFTPNGDGKNDLFGGYGSGIDETTFELRIFTRWGDMVYQTNDIHEWWNGKYRNLKQNAPEAVYVWVVTYKDINLSPHTLRGHVTLIR